MRVGNDEYARLNDSFGATTMRNDHATVAGSTVSLSFRGKHGKTVAARITDRRVARIVKRCQELPGQELFGYVDEPARNATSAPRTSTSTCARSPARTSP